MARLEIFELETPTPTGAMPGADAFARDLGWLEARGIAVGRHGLDRDRAAFDANELVRSTLETTGTGALPLVLADDTILSAGAYPSRPELTRALGLSSVADEDYAARLVAAGTALGLALARHDAAAIESAHARLLHLGLTRPAFAQTVRELSASGVPTDPQVAEALDRLAAHGSLRKPGGPCCDG
jgi:hypothetical protein